MKFIELKTTFENVTDAENMANYLLDKKLIACGQILNINSTYVWKNERCKNDEFMLIMKTKKSLFKILEKEIKSKHPYEVCELISTPINNTTKEYAKWIKENTI